jgi:hypothetical protein
MENLGTKLSLAALLIGFIGFVQAGSTLPANAQVACCFAGNDNCCDSVDDATKKTLSPIDLKHLVTRLESIHKKKDPEYDQANLLTQRGHPRLGMLGNRRI